MKSASTSITVEVHCQRPIWAMHLPEKRYQDSRYRIYIDNDLITERSWIWDNTIYLKEHLWAKLDPTATHSVRLVPITHIPEQAKFELCQFLVTGKTVDIVTVKPHEITFNIV